VRSDAPVHDVEAVGAQLERILSGVLFAKADQLRRFLAFIVGEVLEGRGGDLKEHVIGVRVLRKDAAFDPRTDPIVRVQARRLRAKLERYYGGEGASEPLVIELPRGTYAPVIRSRDVRAAERGRASPALLARNTIAVAPIVALGSVLAEVAEGVRAEIIERITTLPGVRIVDGLAGAGASRPEPAFMSDGHLAQPAAALTSTGALASRPEPALVIGGSLRAAGDRVRVSLHLLDNPGSTYLWAASFDGTLADPFSMQERAAEAVQAVLAAKLRAVGGPRALQPTENLAARNFCLQGRYHLSQRTEDGLRRAVDFFERAISEDERYALAHSGLSDAYCLLGHYGVLGPAEVWSRAASFAASAVLLDEQCAEAHTSLAHIRAAQDWDWAGAEREFERALALDPRYATAHHWFAASCLAPLGRLDEALDEMLTAEALDPISSIVARDVAVMHFYRRDFDAALEQCDHTIELNPHFAPAYVTLALIQEQRGDFDESAAAFERALQLAPGTPRILTGLARNLALAGDAEASRNALERVTSLSEGRYVSPCDVAWVWFALGDRARGYELLGKAFADRSFDVMAAHVDPRFDEMRGNPRFERLVGQLRIEA
jgi:tetratricopeptide (TPR) repeat protein